MEIAIIIAITLMSIQLKYNEKPIYTGLLYRFIELILDI